MHVDNGIWCILNHSSNNSQVVEISYVGYLCATIPKKSAIVFEIFWIDFKKSLGLSNKYNCEGIPHPILNLKIVATVKKKTTLRQLSWHTDSYVHCLCYVGTESWDD